MALAVEKIIRTAEKLVAKGKLEAAIKEYRKILAENPNDANILNRVGDLYARIERFDEAAKLFSQIAEKYAHDGFHVKAIAIYKKIIKLDPTALQIYERLAELYHKQGLINEARTQYQVLAGYYEKHNNPTSAANIYQRMAELEPDNPQYFLKLAELYRGLQLADKAVGAYNQLADLLLVNGSIDEATRVYLSALEVGKDNLGFIKGAVSSLHQSGHLDAAKKVLAKAVELNPDARKLTLELGLGATEDELPPDTLPVGFEPEPGDAEPVEVEEEISFEVDVSSLEVPEVDVADETDVTRAAVFEPVAAEPEGEGELDEFSFTLEGDDVPDTQVLPPPDMAEEAAQEVEVDWSMEDLGSGSGFAVGEAEPVEIELEAPEIELEAPEIELEAAQLEAPVEAGPEVGPEAVRHEDDLLAEAKVFWKYGLAEKAEDRLRELLVIHPQHLGGLQLLARLDLAAGRRDEALAGAETVRRMAAEAGDVEIWNELHQELIAAGLSADETVTMIGPAPADLVLADEVPRPDALAFGEVEMPLAEEAVAELEVAELAMPELEPLALDEVVGELPAELEPVVAEAPPPVAKAPAPIPPSPLGPVPATAVPEPARTSRRRISELLDDLKEFEVAARKPPVRPAPAPPAKLPEIEAPAVAAAGPDTVASAAVEPAAAAAEKQMVSLVDELGLGDLDEEMGEAFEVATAAPRPEPRAMDPLDETGMSWLDEITDNDTTKAQTEAIFDEEDDFFDLASELEAELADDDTAEAAGVGPQGESLQDIIDSFKKGVAENLSAEDYDTHFNLGIAYREMGLLDEAIGEFQLSSKDSRYMVDSAAMLGLCFLEKGLPDLAVRWYQRGLESPTISEDQSLGLLYDMGSAYEMVGDQEKAYKTFVEIYGLNSNFRDVSSKVQELSPAS